MTIIICAIIILWLTVVSIIYQIYQLNKTIQMIDTRSQSNFSLLYRHDSLITSVNKYIASKAMEAAIIDNMSKEKYVDDNGDIIGKDGCPVEASFIKDILCFNSSGEKELENIPLIPHIFIFLMKGRINLW